MSGKYLDSLKGNIINIDEILLERMRDVIDVKKVFDNTMDTDCRQFPSAAMHKIAIRVMNGNLAYEPSRKSEYIWDYCQEKTGCGSLCWSDIIQYALTRRFQNIKNELSATISSEWIQNIVQNLFFREPNQASFQRPFMIFSETIVKCKNSKGDKKECLTDDINDPKCQACEYKESCIQQIFYDAKKNDIEAWKKQDYTRKTYLYHSEGEWLTQVYRFSEIVNNDKYRDKLQKIFDQTYEETVLAGCRRINALSIARKVVDNITEQEVECILNEYFELYDSNMDEADKIEFEQMVHQYAG